MTLRPGKLCRNGHDHGRGKSLRYVSTGRCLECVLRAGIARSVADLSSDPPLSRIRATLYAVNAAHRLIRNPGGKMSKAELRARHVVLDRILNDDDTVVVDARLRIKRRG